MNKIIILLLIILFSCSSYKINQQIIINKEGKCVKTQILKRKKIIREYSDYIKENKLEELKLKQLIDANQFIAFIRLSKKKK